MEEAKLQASKVLCKSVEDITLVQDNKPALNQVSRTSLPMSCLGWPNVNHPDYQIFFPTQLLETGHDILFFWVARIVMNHYHRSDIIPHHTV
jgi:valyl-tRNA synthetase